MITTVAITQAACAVGVVGPDGVFRGLGIAVSGGPDVSREIDALDLQVIGGVLHRSPAQSALAIGYAERRAVVVAETADVFTTITDGGIRACEFDWKTSKPVADDVD